MTSPYCLLRQKHPTVPVGAHVGATHPPVPETHVLAAGETPKTRIGRLRTEPGTLPGTHH